METTHTGIGELRDLDPHPPFASPPINRYIAAYHVQDVLRDHYTNTSLGYRISLLEAEAVRHFYAENYLAREGQNWPNAATAFKAGLQAVTIEPVYVPGSLDALHVELRELISRIARRTTRKLSPSRPQEAP